MAEEPGGAGGEGASRDAGGFVLALAVVALLGLTLLAHGALVLARHEARLARTSLGLFEASSRAAVELAGPAAVEGLPRELGVQGEDVLRRSGPEGSVHTVRRRVGREWWVVEVEVRPPGPWPTGARLRAPAWAPELAARVAAAGAVVEVRPGAPVEGAGRVDGSRVRAPPAGRGGLACHRWDPALDSLGLGSLPGVGPAHREGPWPALGLLGPDTLLARAPVRVSGSGTPTPTGGLGGCGEGGAWSWGDPRPSATRCAGFMVVRGAPGDLEVRGGVGQGLFVVRGDLGLEEGADLRGLVLVGGRLTLRGGSRIHGLAQAGGGVAVEEGSEVVGSACWAAEALAAGWSRMGAAVRPPGGPPPVPLPPRP